MSSFLAQMGASSQARADRYRPAGPAPCPSRPLVLNGFDVIAEVKLSTPSEGTLVRPADPIQTVVAQAKAYAQGGAAAISVLTEPERFGGHMDHLRAVAGAVDVPVMRKDFLVDPVQVHQAREAGASGVLLILALLDDQRLSACLEVARRLEMFVLLEAFDAQELSRAAAYLAPGTLLGLNCRDLRTLQVQPGRLQALRGHFPQGTITVAESGTSTPSDAADLAACGYDMALVGTALMRSTDPAQATAELVAAGRQEEVRCVSG